MENTNPVQFPKDDAEFFLAKGESYVGPFRPSEIYHKLQAGEVTWVDHCYREKEGAWMRIAEHPVFKVLQPEPPKPKPKASSPPPPPTETLSQVKWFLFQNETQSGPYAEFEVKRLILNGQIAESDFLWQEAFSEWKPAREVPEFKSIQGAGPPPPVVQQTPPERRAAPRKPLVAQIYLTNQKEVIAGICRDISIGGMQVLTDRVPGKPGDTIQLNVLPPATIGLKPFVATGVIVRILEDGRGFSFRFAALAPEAKQAIEGYIK